MLRSLLRQPLALLLALAALSACAAAPDPAEAGRAQACRPQKRVELPLRQARNFLLTPATLNGQPATMLVDTGTVVTTLTPQAAASLNLPPDKAHERDLAGITGTVRSASRLLHQVALAGTVVAGPLSVALGELPSLDGLDPPVAGLLGIDVLAQFDMELNLPAGRMTLFTPSPCADYRPWANAVAVPFQRNAAGLALLDVQVDGRPVRALLDTGARTSLMTEATARALGVTPAMLAADAAAPAVGVGNTVLTFRQHRFASLGVPGAIAHDMPVNVADLHLPDVEMLLGADYLGPRRVWISYAIGKLFLQ